jgi:hypothetical protein
MDTQGGNKARLIRCDDLLEADVNGEIVALHIQRGQCYGLNSVASDIWRMLAEPSTIDEMCERLVQEYEVDAGSCRAEVERLIADLEAEGLVGPAKD